MKRTTWFVLISLVLLLAAWMMLAAGSTPLVSAQANPTPTANPTVPPELEAVRRKMLEDSNKGDIASYMAAWTDDPVFIHPSCPATRCIGKPAVQKFFEGTISGGTKLDHVATYPGAAPNEIKTITIMRGNAVQSRGADRIILTWTYTFSGTKLSRVMANLELRDPQTLTYVKANRPDPESVYRQLVADVNKGNVVSAMGAFADDAVIVGTLPCPPANPCVGKAAIQKSLEALVQAHTQLDILSATTTMYSVQGLLEARSDPFIAAGAERAILNGSVSFIGQKVSRLEVTGEPSDPQTAALYKALQAQPTVSPVPK